MKARGVEVWHSEFSAEERKQALKIALENKLFISGGSDHEGLCGGLYSTLEHPEESRYWAPECSLGTTKEFFEEIKSGTPLPERNDYIEECLRNL